VRADRFAAERWFLSRGLPGVLRPGALWRRVWSRSAPALAGLAVMMASSVLIVAVSGKHTIDIHGRPTRTQWFLLAVLVLVVPATALTGWLVARLDTVLRRDVAATASAAVIALGAVLGGTTSYVSVNVTVAAVAVAVILAGTVTGVGSIVGWAARTTIANFTLAAGMFVRALPVVLLTVLVFFNSYVWLMAAVVSRARLWLALVFLILIAAVFLISSTLDRVRPLLADPDAAGDDPALLAGTPFADMPEAPATSTLSRGERVNVVFVVAASQVGQVLTVAALTSVIYLVLGLILLSPELLAAWTRDGSSSGRFLGMTLPVPEALIQTSMFLGALTFMYLSAKAVVDGEYRARFLDPLVDDLRLTLMARHRYRSRSPREQT
jgi:hypothetical protein